MEIGNLKAFWEILEPYVVGAVNSFLFLLVLEQKHLSIKTEAGNKNKC